MRKRQRVDENNQPITRKALPLLGDLQAYLLTADLTYANQVASPDAQTVGEIVSKLRGKGAWRGLHQAGQLTTPFPNEDEVVAAFIRVYSFVEEHLTQEERDLIQFDPIIIEHTLCKYQRLMRLLKASPGSGEF